MNEYATSKSTANTTDAMDRLSALDVDIATAFSQELPEKVRRLLRAVVQVGSNSHSTSVEKVAARIIIGHNLRLSSLTA
jgi:hypothetical protein